MTLKGCAEGCREGASLGDAACPSVKRYVRVRARDGEWLHRCRRSGLLFKDLSYLDLEPMPEQPEVAAVTPEVEQIHFRRFGARLRNTDDRGGMYPLVGYDQEKLKGGVFDRVDQVLRDVGAITRDQPFNVLEVGCSSGFLLAELASKYPHAVVAGVDPSPVSAGQAAELYGLDVHCGTLDDAGFPDAAFDVAIMLGNLMLHPHPERTLLLVQRMLRPGGLLLFDVKNPRSTARLLLGVLSRLPLIGRAAPIRKLAKRSFHGMRFGMSKAWLGATLAVQGWDVVRSRTVPPRQLEYSNRLGWSTGLSGLLWKATDRLDAWRDERAWLEYVCVRPTS